MILVMGITALLFLPKMAKPNVSGNEAACLAAGMTGHEQPTATPDNPTPAGQRAFHMR